MTHETRSEFTVSPAPDIDGCTHLHSGKVRDLYDVVAGPHAGALLMVASDRISAFDHILQPSIPDKGELLTRMSTWWLEQLSGVVDHHLVSAEVPAEVAGRAVVCERLDMIPIECVARGYLTGSAFSEYRLTGGVCGTRLPAGLREGSRLPAPIFTPAVKAELGHHDVNIDYQTLVESIGTDAAAVLRDRTLVVYERAHSVALDRGLVLADTKLEFGYRTEANGFTEIVLGDEVGTPDSSRYWAADEWQPGRAQVSYDKQVLRDWLTRQSGWDRQGAPPPLPDDVVERMRRTYVQVFERLTSISF